MNQQTPDQSYELGTLINAFRVLDQLAESEQELGLSELSRLLNLPKATTYRLLVTLKGHAFVRQNEETSRYTLGLQLWELGRRAVDRLDLKAVARPWLERLLEETEETVMLVILDGDLLVYVEKLDTPQPIQINPRSLGIAPLHASASGKAFLAFGPATLLEQLPTTGLTAYTEHTITERHTLEDELATIRKQGWAASIKEWRNEMASLAAPVWNAQGTCSAVVTLSGPVERFSPDRQEALVHQLLYVTREISRALGYRENVVQAL